MDLVIIAAILFVVGVPLLLAALLLGGNKLADWIIGDRHRDLESVLERGAVPARWSAPFARRIAHAAQAGDEEQVAQLRQEAQASYLKRLDQLAEYIGRTRLVDSDETRQSVQARLREIKRSWEEGENT